MAPKSSSRRGGSRRPANCRPRAKGDIQNCVLTEEEERLKHDGVTAFIAEHHLHPDPKVPAPQITDLLRVSKGGRPDDIKKTVNQYRPYWKELGRFATKLGDFRTAAICDDELRPSNPLPADPDTIILWFNYKALEEGVPVCEARSSTTHAKFANGEVIKAVGQWKSPVNIRRARTAINMIHQPFRLCRGDYKFACPACVKSNEPLDFTGMGRQWRSCVDHSSGALLRVSGNPVMEEKCKKVYAQTESDLDAKHTVSGNVQLTPSQVRRIRDNLFNSGGGNNLYNMQTYVMMLIGIHLFLRADEVISLGFDNFQMDAAQVESPENRVDSLVVWVKGKTDKHRVFLRLYRDDENPDFCPIRHLLCYIQATGLKGGCLFPKWELLKPYLDNPSAGNGVFDTHVTYENFLGRMQVSRREQFFWHEMLFKQC